MIPRLARFFLIFFVLSGSALKLSAQLNKITVDLNKDKPKKFENKTLRSEKTGEKKFTVPRKFIQNTVSHYNYYFNANNKINTVIERARIANQDNYARLLPYYSFSLDNTSSQKNELDSVIEKATAGILLHDLRSDWVDNFYMLIGKAYYLRKDFDSAYMAFQFINFNLAPKKKNDDDYNTLVGSNQSKQPGGLSIASKEDRKLLDKLLSKAPSRNDALVWQIRTLTDMGNYGEAAGLINTLKNDPNFPQRLEQHLDEVTGYWFFKQKMYDSAINYIEWSLPNSLDLQDRARREYLLGQLYEQKESFDTAAYYYDKSIRHTTDPLLDIYANLNKAKMLINDDPQSIKNSIGHLLQMAKKDKYEGYRDIIFFSAANLAMDIPDTTSAIMFYKRSTAFNEKNIEMKNAAFLTLAEISYELGKYRDAYNYYDSLQAGDSTLGDMSAIIEKKNALALIVNDINIIEREDSLQRIAAMPTNDREDFLKKLSKKLKKERGITDDENYYASSANPFGNKDQSIDLFSSNATKGDWYFYNASVKGKGFTDFKREWGNRQNVDNWRLKEGNQMVTQPTRPKGPPPEINMTPGNTDPMDPTVGPNPIVANQVEVINQEQEDVSTDALRANLPLTQPQLDTSNAKKAKAMYQLGKNYQNLLEDYRQAIHTYENSLARFPDSTYGGELYMNLSYCYDKIGDLPKAKFYKDQLLTKFGNSQYADYLQHPEKFDESKKDTAATKRYDDIYVKFIEGNFADAVAEKNQADSIYGKTYWNPQLLYIESVYYIRQRQDSMAMNVLEKIVDNYPENPMKEKALNMMSVLSRRDSIENFLTNLKIERLPEDSEIVVFDDTRIYGNIPEKLERNDSNLIPRVITTVDVPEIREEKKLPEPIKNKNFVFDPYSPQNVVMVLYKVDPVYSSEARNAFIRYNREKFYNQKIDIVKDTLDADRTLLIFSDFVSAEAALKYMNRLKHDAPGEISWLPKDKYQFYIISQDNIELLKENKKLESYLELLKEKFPDNF